MSAKKEWKTPQVATVAATRAHTTAPWEARRDSRRGTVEIVSVPTGIPVAVINGGAEVDADSHLIVAAPDLLEVATALLGLVRDCDACDGTGHNDRHRPGADESCLDCGGVGETIEFSGEIGDLRAAIAKAKARGES